MPRLRSIGPAGPCSRCGTVCSFGSGCLPPPLSSSCSCCFRSRCGTTTLRDDVVRRCHDGSTGGRFGITKTQDQVARRAYWHRWREPFDGLSDSARSAPGIIAGLLRNRAIFNHSSLDRHGRGSRSTSRGPIRRLGILARVTFERWSTTSPSGQRRAHCPTRKPPRWPVP